MSRIYILCVEGEPEVLDAVVHDLAVLEEGFPIEAAGSAAEARRAVRSILAEGDRVGLILCDHVLPGENGADLLMELGSAPETASARKVLLSGQAGLKALGRAHLDGFIGKPWSREELLEVVKQQLTDFVLEAEENFLPYFGVLDGGRLANAMRVRGTARDR